jgi:hypothetical protein
LGRFRTAESSYQNGNGKMSALRHESGLVIAQAVHASSSRTRSLVEHVHRNSVHPYLFSEQTAVDLVTAATGWAANTRAPMPISGIGMPMTKIIGSLFTPRPHW